MGFTYKTLVIIDVGIDDDMATLYLEIVRGLKHDMFTHCMCLLFSLFG